MDDQICPKCKYPKKAAGDGTLTQWLLICSCNAGGMDAKLDSSRTIEVTLCRACGKRIGQGRSGSLTQFIFRFDICSCENPNPITHVVAADAIKPLAIPETLEGDSFLEGNAIDVSPEAFPIERYKPLAALGTGGAGNVFLAVDGLLKKRVAVKVLRNVVPTQVIAFQEEAKAISRLKHEHIVEIHDFALTPSGAPYMVLDFVDGTSLGDIIALNNPLEIAECLDLFKQICDALSYSHRNGIFHRDIKPSNILIDVRNDGTFSGRIIDFGLAKIMHDKSQQVEGVTLAGTPLYMSPDQALGRPFDARSEIYSLGCVMFESLTGRPPFQGEGSLETLSMHAEMMPPRLDDAFGETYSRGDDHSKPEPAFPSSLQKLVDKCLSKDPNARFQSMDQLLSALDKIDVPLVRAENVSTQPTGFESSSPSSATARPKPMTLKVVAPICVFGIAIAGCFFIFININDNESDTPKIPSQTRPEYETRFDSDAITRTVRPDAEKVELKGSFDDISAKTLAKYTRVVELNLGNNLISDEATQYINSPRIKKLDLSSTDVATLEFIPRLKSLDFLNLAHSSINNDSLARISTLPNLTYLDISGTSIDDGAIPALRRMQLLRFLEIRDLSFSEATIEKLRMQLPSCRIAQRDSLIPVAGDRTLSKLLVEKRYNQLVKEFSHLISVVEKSQGKDSVNLCEYLLARSRSYLELRKFALAEADTRRSLSYARAYGNSSLVFASLLDQLAVVSRDPAYGDVEKLSKETVAAAKECYGVSIETTTLELQVAHFAYNGKAIDCAERIFLESIACAKKLIESNEKVPARLHSSLLATAYLRLGSIEIDRKNYAKAQDYIKKTEEEILSYPDPQHTYETMPLLAGAYAYDAFRAYQEGKFNDAVEIQKKCVALVERFNVKELQLREKDLKLYLKMQAEQRNKGSKSSAFG
jgi:Serine/threonine protein kinase